jgi:hypothetical protein
VSSVSYRPKHISTNSPRYRSRMKFLSDLFQGRIFDQLGTDPLDDMDPKRPGEAAMVGKMQEESGWTQEQILDWFVMESTTNSINWIVDQLLGAAAPDQRKQFGEIPVCVTDTGVINVSTHHDGDKLGISVDRGLLAFIDYVLRLIHIEVFRPHQAEFLSDPPSHDDVLRLLRKAGSTYHTGKWSAGIHPISRMHFKQAINSNLTVARTGALIFLIAHEYGHIALGHLSGMAEMMRQIDSPSLPIVMGQEIMADNFAMELALSTIAAISPSEIDRCHLEIGVFLFLFGLNLAELGILLDLGEDVDRFNRTYVSSHGTGLSRATSLMEEYSNLLSGQTPALAIHYIETTNTLAEEMRKMETQHGRT